MKLNNKGFALTSIIYMLIVLFLMILLLILANLAQRKVVLDKIKNDVKINLNQGGQLAKNTYTVTFDPQGGELTQTTKQVTYNEPYGELPTPTKEGYKFVGWRGRNLFDKNSAPETDISYINGDGSKTIYGAYAIYKTNINPNTQYTIINSGRSNAPGYALYDENNNFITGAGYSNTANVTFTTPSNAAYIRFSVVANQEQNETYRYDKDYFQLEEGSTATSYEPYQEYTKDTIVTKQENHTLYAKWEPLYTVTFDPDGGTLTETTKQVEYHQPYGNLPTPNKTGYTFMGWNGKNILNYNELSTVGVQYGFEVDNDGYVSDTSPTTDSRIWQYENSNWFTNLNEGTYTLTERFSTTTSDSVNSNIYLYDNSNNIIFHNTYGSLFNVNEVKNTFTINSNTNLGLLIKSYDGIYKIQLEEGTTSTEWEPYYITPSTTVVQEKNHTLKAIWKANE